MFVAVLDGDKFPNFVLLAYKNSKYPISTTNRELNHTTTRYVCRLFC